MSVVSQKLVFSFSIGYNAFVSNFLSLYPCSQGFILTFGPYVVHRCGP
uniref:Uncharacterized protein n=1 Tax=Rhizophora mucronata TaxID=61149 RepID=A0A2P2QJ19_RHIMU